MADNPAKEASPPERRAIGDYLTSVMLVVSTMVVGIICAVFLASTLTQTRMSGISVNGVNINIWKLNEIRGKWSGVRKQIDEMTQDLANIETLRRQLAKDRLDVGATFETKQTELVIALAEYSLRLTAVKGPPREGEVLPPPSKDPATLYARVQAEREPVLKDHPELKPLVENVDRTYEEYRPARSARAELNARTESLPPEIKVFQAAIAGTRTSLDTLFEQISIKLDEGTRGRVENVLYELDSGWLNRFLNPLIMLQPDILTLALVILMGVLGSSLQITYTFFKRQQSERLGVYFLRVCVGAITALVIFIVAKAGVPVIADASRLGGDAPINPYFVSFLAIISGLMSERAIISVQAQAGRFFGPVDGAESARWARHDLHDEFTGANRKPEEVKKLLAADDAEFAEWIGATKSMPGEAQKMIAGVLGKPVRELFTDIPPDGPPKPAQG